MSYSQNRRFHRSIKVLAFISLALLLCLGSALLFVNVRPGLLLSALGLHHVGPLESALPPPPERLRLTGAAQDQVEVLVPPRIAQPLVLTPAELGAPIIADTSTPGVTAYLITVPQVNLNDLLQREGLFAVGHSSPYRDLQIDLQPAGLVLYGDVHFGVRWHRMGLLLLQRDGVPSLSPVGVVLDDELHSLPEEGGLLARLLLPSGRGVERALRVLTIVGPLPAEARAELVRFHSDRLEILARATYSVAALPDTGWQRLEPGVEWRELEVAADPARPPERLRIVRLDPTLVRFRVRYDPDEPRRVSAWAAEEGVLLAVNGGYFTPRDEGGRTIGLLVSDGERWGRPLASYAGMFAVTAGGEVSVRWLEQWPYVADELLADALQSFPVLVKPGGVIGFLAGSGEGATARRTVVAQDAEGNVLFIVAPRGYLSLHELAAILAGSDMMIDVALNLDGGASTGMWVLSGDGRLEVDSFVPVPSVITVESR